MNLAGWQDRAVPAVLGLAFIDAAAAIYLTCCALRRRDKPAVLVVGVLLGVCAATLTVVGWPKNHAGPPAPKPGAGLAV
jgi:hypothetical protein